MFSAGYFATGVLLTIIGVVFLVFAAVSLLEALSVRAASRPRSKRHRRWMTLLALAVVFIGVGTWLSRVGFPANAYYGLEVEAVATTTGGQVYLITPLDNALRCVVAAECVEIQAGDHVLYRPDKSSRNGIVDVHKG